MWTTQTPLITKDLSDLAKKQNKNDAIIDSREGIQQHVVQFYQNLLGGAVTQSMVSEEDIAALLPF